MDSCELSPMLLDEPARVVCPSCQRTLVTGNIVVLVQYGTEMGVTPTDYHCCKPFVDMELFSTFKAACRAVDRLLKRYERDEERAVEYIAINAEFIPDEG